jgi:hypothetical protein
VSASSRAQVLPLQSPKGAKIHLNILLPRERVRLGIPVKLKVDSGGKPNGIPERRSTAVGAKRRFGGDWGYRERRAQAFALLPLWSQGSAVRFPCQLRDNFPTMSS